MKEKEVNDGTDKTTDDLLDRDAKREVKTKIDGKEVIVGYDKDEKPYLVEIPEDIEDPEDFKRKVIASKDVVELGNTLRNAKKVRTEQNQFQKEYDNLKTQSEGWATKEADLQEQIKRQTAELAKMKTEVGAERVKIISGTRKDIIYKKMKEILGVTTNAELSAERDTDEYQDAWIEANVFAAEQADKSKTQLIFENQNIGFRQNRLMGLVENDKTGYKVKSSEVLAYAKAKGLLNNLQWTPEEIYFTYKQSHSQRRLDKDINTVERIKAQTIRVLPKGRIIPRTEDEPTFEERETEKMVQGIKNI